MADQEEATIKNALSTESFHQITCQILVSKGKYTKQNPVLSGTIQVIENLESRGSQEFHFSGLESHRI